MKKANGNIFFALALICSAVSWAQSGISGVYIINERNLTGSLYAVAYNSAEGRGMVDFRIKTDARSDDYPSNYLGDIRIASAELASGADGSLTAEVSISGSKPCRFTASFKDGRAVIGGADRNCKAYMGYEGRMDGVYLKKTDAVSGIYESDNQALLVLERFGGNDEVFAFVTEGKDFFADSMYRVFGKGILENSSITAKADFNRRFTVKLEGDTAVVIDIKNWGDNSIEGIYRKLKY